jgi:hypothetical protein
LWRRKAGAQWLREKTLVHDMGQHSVTAKNYLITKLFSILCPIFISGDWFLCLIDTYIQYFYTRRHSDFYKNIQI